MRRRLLLNGTRPIRTGKGFLTVVGLEQPAILSWCVWKVPSCSPNRTTCLEMRDGGKDDDEDQDTETDNVDPQAFHLCARGFLRTLSFPFTTRACNSRSLIGVLSGPLPERAYFTWVQLFFVGDQTFLASRLSWLFVPSPVQPFLASPSCCGPSVYSVTQRLRRKWEFRDCVPWVSVEGGARGGVVVGQAWWRRERGDGWRGEGSRGGGVCLSLYLISRFERSEHVASRTTNNCRCGSRRKKTPHNNSTSNRAVVPCWERPVPSLSHFSCPGRHRRSALAPAAPISHAPIAA